MMELLVAAAAFLNVFCLGLNSKLLRDDKVAAAFVVSWFITLAQFGTVWAIAFADLSALSYLFWAGLGGSTGITLSQYFYRWYDRRFHK